MTEGDPVTGSAFEPEQPAPTRKTYRVLGDRMVLGWEPGDTFSQPIPEEQERRLIQRGQLEVVDEERVEERAPVTPPQPTVTEPSDGNNRGVGDPEAGQE